MSGAEGGCGQGAGSHTRQEPAGPGPTHSRQTDRQTKSCRTYNHLPLRGKRSNWREQPWHECRPLPPSSPALAAPQSPPGKRNSRARGIHYLTCHSTQHPCPATSITGLHRPKVAPSQPAYSILTVAGGLSSRDPVNPPQHSALSCSPRSSAIGTRPPFQGLPPHRKIHRSTCPWHLLCPQHRAHCLQNMAQSHTAMKGQRQGLDGNWSGTSVPGRFGQLWPRVCHSGQE